ncbi:MAG: PAS domain S-box protein [Candidatus Eisenbacteria bacterium]|nr:PAS domain S-box protein [Candidatus Eisenbacteria bacterium]
MPSSPGHGRAMPRNHHRAAAAGQVEDALGHLAGRLQAQSLLLLAWRQNGALWRSLRHGPDTWPLQRLLPWLRRPRSWGLPTHTLLDPWKSAPGEDWNLPPRTRLILLREGEPLGALFFVPRPETTPVLDAETVAYARLLAQAGLLREERDREAELLRRTAEILDQGLIAVDGAGTVVRYEGRAQAILGYEPQAALGHACEDVFRPADLTRNPLRHALQGKLDRVELYVLHASGKEVPVSVGLSRLAGGDEPGAVGLLRDIADDRALEENARRRDRLASIGELAAGAAHEIRNPLTGIINCAQVLRDRLREHPQNQRLAGLILQEGDRLARLVSSMLKFAQPGPPQMRRGRAEDCLRHVLQLEEKELCRAGIEVRESIAAELPAVYLDPDQMTQVLLNLVRNAREAMGEGGELTAAVELTERHPHRRKGLGRRSSDRVRFPERAPLRPFVRVSIQDSGPGIPESVRSRIFDPFFTTRANGSGLGLCISQSIVQEHGGFISVHSVPGRGTKVEVDLPVERRHGERRRDINQPEV